MNQRKCRGKKVPTNIVGEMTVSPGTLQDVGESFPSKFDVPRGKINVPLFLWAKRYFGGGTNGDSTTLPQLDKYNDNMHAAMTHVLRILELT